MELETGTPLRKLIGNDENLSDYNNLWSILDPVLSALKVVHQELLHRDIKPDNIIIRQDSTPVLIDFGAARTIQKGRNQIDRETSASIAAMVSVGYSPIQQHDNVSEQFGPWTDIYALSAVLYHIISGRRPPSAADRRYNDTMRPTTDFASPAVPMYFLRAIDHGLSVLPEDRPKSVDEFRLVLMGEETVRSLSSFTTRASGNRHQSQRRKGAQSSQPDAIDWEADERAWREIEFLGDLARYREYQ